MSMGEPITGLKFLSSNQATEIFIPNGSRSQSTNYTGDAKLVFFRERTTPEGQIIRDPKAIVSLPRNMDRVLLLFAASTDQSAYEYRIIPIDDSYTDFPPGSYSFLNFTGQPLALKLEDDLLSIPANENRKIQPEKDQSINLSIQIAKAEEQSDQWQLAYSSVWEFRPNRRILAIILPSKEDASGPVSLRLLKETIYPYQLGVQ